MQEGEILLEQRLVQAERRHGARLLGLVGLRIDQEFDRIADRINAQEYDHRHHQQYKTGLRQAAEGVGEHA